MKTEPLHSATVELLLVIVNRHDQRLRNTYSDLAEATGWSRSTVHGHVQRLKRQGLVTDTPGRHATLLPTVTRLHHSVDK